MSSGDILCHMSTCVILSAATVFDDTVKIGLTVFKVYITCHIIYIYIYVIYKKKLLHFIHIHTCYIFIIYKLHFGFFFVKMNFD